MKDKNTTDVIGYFNLWFLGEGTRITRLVDAGVKNVIANVIKVGSNAIEHISRLGNFSSYEAFGSVDILEPFRLREHLSSIFKISGVPVSQIKNL